MFQRFVVAVVQHRSNRSFSISSPLMNLVISMKKLINEQKYQEALDVFNQNSTSRSDFAINLALKSCTKLKNLEYGRNIHQCLSSSTINNPFINTSLIHFYMSCGDEDSAYRVFDGIKSKTSVTYGAMFKGFITNKKPEKVFELFDQMLIKADEVNLIILFNACAQLPNERASKLAQKMFNQMPKEFSKNPLLVTSTLQMLMKFGDISNAENVFAQTKTKDIIMYGVIMKGFFENKIYERILDIFEEMPFNPNQSILIILFKACTQLDNERARKLGRRIFNEMPKEFSQDLPVINTYLHMLMKFGDILNAENIFTQMKMKNVVTYGVIMQGFSENKMYDKTLDIFEEMPFPPDKVILIILFKTCTQLANERALKLARRLFNQMSKQFYKDSALVTSTLHMLMNFGDITIAETLFNQVKIKNMINYGAMMNGYNINNQPEKCLKLFKQMQEKDIGVDEIILSIIIGACSQIGLHSICQPIVEKIPSHLSNNHRLQNMLIDMWGKVGYVHQALNIFQHVEKPDKITYTVMINAFGLNGMGNEAIDLYRRMPIDIQNEITDICILNACSHSGLVNEAHSIFNETKVKTEKIITTMVDCLSRMFMFDEAQKLIDNFELSHPPYLVMYMALLSGARNHRNPALSRKVYDRMKHLFPNNKQDLIAGAVLLSNTYSSVGEDQQAEQVRFQRIEQFGKEKMIGMSWTESNGNVVRFNAHDHTHPQSKQIYDELSRMSTELINNGHQYDSAWITRGMKDDETIESILCGHSEKLAIAFNFIQNPIPDIIQVSKNLRVCGDCHSATKLIAKIRQRPIILRDANRLHHFSVNGQCSCQDYF